MRAGGGISAHRASPASARAALALQRHRMQVQRLAGRATSPVHALPAALSPARGGTSARSAPGGAVPASSAHSQPLSTVPPAPAPDDCAAAAPLAAVGAPAHTIATSAGGAVVAMSPSASLAAAAAAAHVSAAAAIAAAQVTSSLSTGVPLPAPHAGALAYAERREPVAQLAAPPAHQHHQQRQRQQQLEEARQVAPVGACCPSASARATSEPGHANTDGAVYRGSTLRAGYLPVMLPGLTPHELQPAMQHGLDGLQKDGRVDVQAHAATDAGMASAADSASPREAMRHTMPPADHLQALPQQHLQLEDASVQQHSHEMV
eukprot:241379-Chlamydomonas_euryale.AAC.1